MRRGGAAVAFALMAAWASLAADPADLERARQLAWAKQFAESEALYRRILSAEPGSYDARLGLARVVMWSGRYSEAIVLFDSIQPETAETIEGRATAQYWRGDFRSAARGFKEVLTRDPSNEAARRSLAEIQAAARPWQKASAALRDDDQPLTAVQGEWEAGFYSDPLTRWSVVAGAGRLDAERFGDGGVSLLAVTNRTRLGALTFDARLGAMEFPDGARRPVGHASLRRHSLSFRVEQREELAAATALRTHATSTSAALRWEHERRWIGAAEVSARRYFDGNRRYDAVGYAVAPLIERSPWTVWGGGSLALRDTEESRFALMASSGTLEQGFFRYQHRGEYDPYWTPVGLREARAVMAIERSMERGKVKLSVDAGVARDRAVAFGPDAGPTPLPAGTFAFSFVRNWRPWRASLSGRYDLTPGLVLEMGIEHGVTIDYRSTFAHVGLVRRF